MQNLKNLKLKQKLLENSYLNFVKKRDKIVKQFRSRFFIYLIFKKIYPNFCPLYKTNKTCHKIAKNKLDCWNCYCQYYDYKYIDETQGLVGRCKKTRNNGKYTKNIWDCSECTDLHEY